MPRSQSMPSVLIRKISSVLLIGISGMPKTSSVSLMHCSREINSDGRQLLFLFDIFLLSSLEVCCTKAREGGQHFPASLRVLRKRILKTPKGGRIDWTKPQK